VGSRANSWLILLLFLSSPRETFSAPIYPKAGPCPRSHSRPRQLPQEPHNPHPSNPERTEAQRLPTVLILCPLCTIQLILAAFTTLSPPAHEIATAHRSLPGFPTFIPRGFAMLHTFTPSRWRTAVVGAIMASALWLPSVVAEKTQADYFVHSLPGAPPGPLLKMHAG
jgi:hypothetical protein